jgi:hypothetical protein
MSENNRDLITKFWEGRTMKDEQKLDSKEITNPNYIHQYSHEYQSAVRKFLNENDNKELGNLADLHYNKELKVQTPEELEDYRQQQLFASDYDESITKLDMENTHLALMNSITKLNYEKNLERYSALLKEAEKIKKLLDHNIEKPVKPEPIDTKAKIYSGIDMISFIAKKDKHYFSSLSLEELESMDNKDLYQPTYDIDYRELYTGTERDEIIKKYAIIQQQEQVKRDISKKIRNPTPGCMSVLNAWLPKFVTDYFETPPVIDENQVEREVQKAARELKYYR